MGKRLLISVLFFGIVSTTVEIEVKRENASKPLSNLFIIFSGLVIITVTFIFTDFIIVCTGKVSKILVYKLQDLCNTYRSMSCAIFSVLGILLPNICINSSAISTV